MARPYQDYPITANQNQNPFDSHVDVGYYGDAPRPSTASDFYPSSNTPDIPLATSHYSQSPIPGSTERLRPPSSGYGMSDGYTPQPAYTQRELSRKPRCRCNMTWILLGIVGLIIVIIGIVVAVVLKGKKNVSGGSGSTPSSPNTPENPNDPSVFTKNPNLHQSFYGLAYTPAGSQLPECGNSLDAVIADIQVMSQLTTRLRLYGADCNQSALVLEAIVQTKVNMTVYLANYPIATDNGTAYERQRGEIQAALQTYPTSLVAGIIVGNEFMLDYVTQLGISDPNSAAADVGAAILLGDINDTKQMLKSMNLALKVGNSDAGSYFNNEVLEDVDYGMANVHPWFANTTAGNGASWTFTFFEGVDVALANSLPNVPDMFIAETGWPTNSTDAASGSDGPSLASVPNLQIFLDTFICQANANGTKYFFFEFADEPWKTYQFGGVEGYWGLLYPNLTLKEGLTIPDCPSQ